jgi:fructokinase
MTDQASGVLVLGEALVDVVVPLSGGTERRPGGSPMNVASGLARLGSRTRLVTSLADDADGALIRAHLETSGVELAASRSDRTSTAIARLQADGSAVYEFDMSWALDDDPDAAARSPRIVHTGSIGTVLAPGAESVFDRMLGARDRSVLGFDPNVRTAITGADGARAAFERFAGVADVVKMSDEDAEILRPGASVAAVLADVLALGPTLAVVTRGGDGAVLASGTTLVEVAAPVTAVVDTVGAGDSFMAGLLHAMDVLMDRRRIDLDDVRSGCCWTEATLRTIGGFGAQCAAVTVARRGADLPRRSEVGPL